RLLPQGAAWRTALSLQIRSPLVFVSKNGRAVNWKWWHREACSLPSSSPVRRSARPVRVSAHVRVLLAASGVPISDPAQDMGHASVGLTMSTMVTGRATTSAGQRGCGKLSTRPGWLEPWWNHDAGERPFQAKRGNPRRVSYGPDGTPHPGQALDQAPGLTCPACGSAVPDGARFCPN